MGYFRGLGRAIRPASGMTRGVGHGHHRDGEVGGRSSTALLHWSIPHRQGGALGDARGCRRPFLPMSIAVRTAPDDVAAAPVPQLYLLSDLGTHSDGSPLLPIAINERGEICVAASPSDPHGPVRGFCLSGALRIPAGVAAGHMPATCLSNHGLVAGTTGSAASELRAWASHLGVFGERHWPESVSIARGINARGVVVGNVLFDGGSVGLSRAFVLHESRTPKYLTPPQGGVTIATAINDRGDITFNAAPLGAPAATTNAWCFREDCYLALGNLGGGRAWATAVTPEGRVVGHATTARGDTHAFLWENGETLDLGTLNGGLSQALAANDHRVVVGRLIDGGNGPRAFRWTLETGLTLLEEHVAAPPGWRLQEAVGINREGMIVGVGTLSGQSRGFALRPTM